MQMRAATLASRSRPASIGVSGDPTSELSRDIALLEDLDLTDLRIRWRQRLRTTPPVSLNRSLLRRLLAYRLQAKVLGDLAPETVSMLTRIAKDNARRLDATDKLKPKAVPPIPPVPRDHSLKPGTLLVREHAGVLHRVMVMADGYAWNGATYTSLSEVARAITGTRWNGPRFFGLRERAGGRNASGDTAEAMASALLAEVGS